MAFVVLICRDSNRYQRIGDVFNFSSAKIKTCASTFVMSATDFAIDVRGVTKKFGARTVVNDIAMRCGRAILWGAAFMPLPHSNSKARPF